jgi:hypothetical protein
MPKALRSSPILQAPVFPRLSQPPARTRRMIMFTGLSLENY